MDNGVQIAPDSISYIDTAGRVVLEETEAFSSSDGWIRREIHLDSMGRVAKQSLPYFSNGGTTKYSVLAYDYLSRVVQVDHPDGSSSLTSYPGGYGFQEIETTEPGVGNKKRTRFNHLGEVVETTDGYGSADAVKTTYTYTHRGQLDKVHVEGKEVANVDYDIAGNRDQIDD